MGSVSLAAGFLAAGLLAGCSTTATTPTATTVGVEPSSHFTAAQESVSWFKAVNAKDRSASLAHFTPQAARNQGDWEDGDVSLWPTFTDLHCIGQRRSASTALVLCTFESHGDPSSADDTFWHIDLHRSSPGALWLITAYGQP
jgi:hypothetical protein